MSGRRYCEGKKKDTIVNLVVIFYDPQSERFQIPFGKQNPRYTTKNGLAEPFVIEFDTREKLSLNDRIKSVICTEKKIVKDRHYLDMVHGVITNTAVCCVIATAVQMTTKNKSFDELDLIKRRNRKNFIADLKSGKVTSRFSVLAYKAMFYIQKSGIINDIIGRDYSGTSHTIRKDFFLNDRVSGLVLRRPKGHKHDYEHCRSRKGRDGKKCVRFT